MPLGGRHPPKVDRVRTKRTPQEGGERALPGNAVAERIVTAKGGLLAIEIAPPKTEKAPPAWQEAPW